MSRRYGTSKNNLETTKNHFSRNVDVRGSCQCLWIQTPLSRLESFHSPVLVPTPRNLSVSYVQWKSTLRSDSQQIHSVLVGGLWQEWVGAQLCNSYVDWRGRTFTLWAFLHEQYKSLSCHALGLPLLQLEWRWTWKWDQEPIQAPSRTCFFPSLIGICWRNRKLLVFGLVPCMCKTNIYTGK